MHTIRMGDKDTKIQDLPTLAAIVRGGQVGGDATAYDEVAGQWRRWLSLMATRARLTERSLLRHALRRRLVTMRCCWGWLATATLALVGLAVPACGSCNCPNTQGGRITVPFPPAAVSRIVSLSADSACNASVGGVAQIDVGTESGVGNCDVHVQLMNGDAYTFTVAFQWVDQGCCGSLVGKAQNLVPQLGDAGAGAQGLPMVPAGCGSTCSTAAGPEVTFVDAASAAAALAGRWRICGAWPGLPNGVVGVELDPASASQLGSDGGVDWGGEGYELVSGSSCLVPKMDFGYLLSWNFEVEDTVVGPKIYLNIDTGAGQGAAGVAHYSACPMRIQIDIAGIVLVPFGG